MTALKAAPLPVPAGVAGLRVSGLQPAGHHRLREHCSGPYHPGTPAGRSRAGQGRRSCSASPPPEPNTLPDVRRTAPADESGPGHHHRPRLVLADEPTGALDSASARCCWTGLRPSTGEGRATILVTHDAFTASHRRRILLQDGAVLTQLERRGRAAGRFSSRSSAW